MRFSFFLIFFFLMEKTQKKKMLKLSKSLKKYLC